MGQSYYKWYHNTFPHQDTVDILEKNLRLETRFTSLNNIEICHSVPKYVVGEEYMQEI